MSTEQASSSGGTDPSEASPRAQGTSLTWLLALVSGIGPFSMQLYLPALPVIQTDLGTTLSATQATVSAFLFAMALAMPLIGPLSDQFGRRPILLGCLSIFVLGSIAGWFAPSIEWLVAARVVQGAGGAGGLILSRAIVSDIYDRRSMARVIAQLSMIMILAPTLAPLAGGLLTDWLGWRSMFVVQASVALFGLLALFRWLPETLATRRRFKANQLFDGFATVLRRPVFVGYMLQGAFSLSLFFAFIAVAPYIASANGRPPSEYGLFFLALAAGYGAGNFITSITAERVDPDRLIVIGLTVSLIGPIAMLILAVAGVTHPLAMFLPASIMVLGQGIANPNSQTGAVKQAPDFAGTASSTASFVQYAFGALVTQLVVLLPNQNAIGVSITLLLLSVAAMLTILLTLRRAQH